MIEDKPKDKKENKKDNKKDAIKEEDLVIHILIQSLEDKELKEKIDHHAERMLENDFQSLKELINIVQSATKTMTSVPKPFKFLKTHYKLFTQHFKTLPENKGS